MFLIFQKSNGAYLYGTTDLATIFERIIDYNPQKILYVTDILMCWIGERINFIPVKEYNLL